MRVIRHLARVPRPLGRAVLTLGNFDGVHLGHQAILRSAVERARADGGQAIVLTFEPHPLTVVAPERAPAVIQPLHDRLATATTSISGGIVRAPPTRCASWVRGWASA